ncbi:MAG: Mut7-C RNAse domain-containing protein [Calditrichia bacterium]
MQFIVDGMLRGLLRWLRILGFDTRELPHLNQSEKIAGELTEKYFLTGSPRHYEAWPHQRKLLIKLEPTGEQLNYLDIQLGIYTRMKLFSRCSLCNSELELTPKENVLERLPPGVAKHFNRFHLCPSCGKVYWEGGHVVRMIDKLRRMGIPINSNYKGEPND